MPGASSGGDDVSGWLDCLESLPKRINYASYLGHSALRTYVMASGAFDQRRRGRAHRDGAPSWRDAHSRGRWGFNHLALAVHETPTAGVRQAGCGVGTDRRLVGCDGRE